MDPGERNRSMPVLVLEGDLPIQSVLSAGPVCCVMRVVRAQVSSEVRAQGKRSLTEGKTMGQSERIDDKWKVFTPPHQLRQDYVSYSGSHASLLDRFQKRLEPQNYRIEYFRSLKNDLLAAHTSHPDMPEIWSPLMNMLLAIDCSSESMLLARDISLKCQEGGFLDDETLRMSEVVASIYERRREFEPNVVIGRVNWSVNNECPMACQGCYNPFSDRHLNEQEARTVVDRLAEHGVRSVVMSGGDPLLWPHLISIAKYARSMGIGVAVDTTAYALTPELLDVLREHVDSLRIPLDSLNSNIEKKFRKNADKNISETLISKLAICDEAGFQDVRVNTVITRHNLERLDDLAREIWAHPCVSQWMVFQWWGRRAPKRLIDDLSVDYQLIREECKKIEFLYPGKKMFYGDSSERSYTSFLIQANGQVVTFGSDSADEFILGSLLDSNVSKILQNPVIDLRAALDAIPLKGWDERKIKE